MPDLVLVSEPADGGGAPDRDLLVKLSAPLPTGDDEQSIEALLFVLARQVSRALARAMAARVGPLGRSASSRT